MDLALNNLQRLICHKTQQTKQTNHHGMPLAQISLIHSHHSSLSLSLSVGLPCYILYQYRAVVDWFWLFTLPLLVHMRGSTWVHHLWAHPYFSSSVPLSCSSNLDDFWDGGQVSIQLLLCGMLPPGLFQYSSQHSCAIAVKLSLHTLSQHLYGVSIP